MSNRGTGYRVPRWALPGELAALDGAPPRRRTLRDWLVDTLVFALAALGWVWGWHELHTEGGMGELLAPWIVTIDPWLGAAACVALWWRRRFPLALAIGSVLLLMLSATAFVAVLIAVFTVAVHRGWLAPTLITLTNTAVGVLWASQWQPPGMTAGEYMTTVVVTFAAPLGWGMMVRFRRQLLLSLRRDAQREREEHARRLVAARRAERERIAREMHDVLAHRISLLSVHAGALVYRSDQAAAGAGEPLATAEVAEAVRVVRDNAHQALAELGEVLTVLRADELDEPDRQPPPPVLSDLPRLAAEARRAGQRVTLDLDGALVSAPPRPQEQRTVYRVVQEGLTNARKHAPGAPVTVRVAGEPGSELGVTVSNPLPAGVAAMAIPGAGAGLAGLAERVVLDGGTLEHGTAGDEFRLAAQLPWRT